MAKRDLLGTLKQQGYEIGKARVYIGDLLSNDRMAGPWQFIGNTPTLELPEIDSTTLDHKSSCQGIGETDALILTERNATGSITMDSMSYENYATGFAGSVGTFSNDANSGDNGLGGVGAGVQLFDDGTVRAAEGGRWYNLTTQAFGAFLAGTSEGGNDRVYNIGEGATTALKMASIVVAPVAAMTTPYVLGTDYELDLALGRIFIRSITESTPGTIPGADAFIYVPPNTQASGVAVDELTLFQTDLLNKALMIRYLDPRTNTVEERVFWKATFEQDGGISMVTEGELVTVSWNLTFLPNVAMDPQSPFGRWRSICNYVEDTALAA